MPRRSSSSRGSCIRASAIQYFLIEAMANALKSNCVAELVRGAVAGPDRKAAAGGDRAELRIQALGRVEEPFEQASRLEVEERLFEPRWLGRTELSRFGLALATKLFSAGLGIASWARQSFGRWRGSSPQPIRSERNAHQAVSAAAVAGNGSSPVILRCSSRDGDADDDPDAQPARD